MREPPLEPDTELIVSVCNPRPDALPTLEVRQRDSEAHVAASFPTVPDFTCECWCYETSVDFLDARDLGGGRLELRHRDRHHPKMIYTTWVTPEPGSVEFLARVGIDTGAPGNIPDSPRVLNLCFQLARACRFASAPDPYPDFVKRCFIFTDQGRTFLDRTVRRKIPMYGADEACNNPPYVQGYVGTWQNLPQVSPDEWSDFSPDRYVTTVIGVISRDREHLAAIANDTAEEMHQAWIDCLHNNAQWHPASAAFGDQTWRVRIYAMENDPDKLLGRVREHFPNAFSHSVHPSWSDSPDSGATA